MARSILLSAQSGGCDKALLILGNIYYDEGNDAAAREALNTYMELYPEDTDALIKMGEMAMDDEKYEEALNYFASAEKIMGDGATAVLLKDMIAAYEYSGDFRSAYDMATEFLDKYSDADVEREYEFLGTRVASMEETYDAGDDEAEAEDAGDDAGEDTGTEDTDAEDAGED